MSSFLKTTSKIKAAFVSTAASESKVQCNFTLQNPFIGVASLEGLQYSLNSEKLSNYEFDTYRWGTTSSISNSGGPGTTDWVDTDNNGVPDDYTQPAFATGQSGSYRSAENGFNGRFFRLDENGDTQIAVEANSPVGWTLNRFYKLSGKYRSNQPLYFRDNLSNALPNSNIFTTNPLPANTGSAQNFELIFSCPGTNNRLQIRIDGTGQWYEIDALKLQEYEVPGWSVLNSPSLFNVTSSQGFTNALEFAGGQNDGIISTAFSMTPSSSYEFSASLYKFDTKTTRIYLFSSATGETIIFNDYSTAGTHVVTQSITPETGSNDFLLRIYNASSGDSQVLVDYARILETGAWSTASIASSSVWGDYQSVRVNGQAKNVQLLWDVVADLNVSNSFSNVDIRARFYDNENKTGDLGPYVSGSVGTVDFRPNSNIVALRPFDFEPSGTFVFQVPRAFRQVRAHYQVELDRSQSFNTNNYTSTDTQGAVEFWTYRTGSADDYTAFPAAGLMMPTESNSTVFVKCEDTAISGLGLGTWYYRISQSLHDV